MKVFKKLRAFSSSKEKKDRAHFKLSQHKWLVKAQPWLRFVALVTDGGTPLYISNVDPQAPLLLRCVGSI
jgi:hypothetical protein